MIRYIALGDSYTIGEGAQSHEAWPNLMVNELEKEHISIELVANPSVTGWTTQDLIEKELPIFDVSNADFVTLLIGVNDWVQEVSIDKFASNLDYILNHIQGKLKQPYNIVLITIPDFGVTPKGAQYSKGRDISLGLSEFNTLIKKAALARNLPLVNLFPISKRARFEADLVAEDGVHGSAKMYALWEKLITPVVFNLLKD